MSTFSATSTFADKIATRHARIGIVGLGYAGLPLALGFAEAGFRVTGIDLSEERVSAVNEHRSYLVDVPADRYAAVQGRLDATTDFGVVAELDALTICVPTPLSKTQTPDLGYVVAATRSVARYLRPDQVIILQSTTYPGTTEDVLRPILEEESGMKVGEDFFLGYAPERVDPGNATWNLRNTPKIVSGVTPECLARTQAVYETVVDTTVPVSSTTVAETVKLHENTFRAVNIALANELALMCDHLGISSWEVIEGAATKPFAFLPHYPGPGLGGDCIPVVPHFLSWRLREYGYSNRLISAAHEVNAAMPQHVIQKVADALNDKGRAIKGARILLLGMAYKPNVHDTRESPSLEIHRQLVHRGADVRYADPWVSNVVIEDTIYESVTWEPRQVAEADLVVMLTPHREFLEQPLWRDATLIVDTRNVIPADQRDVWGI
jgi:UDP-N-acetyl-D-glucosamine dehydrogenase